MCLILKRHGVVAQRIWEAEEELGTWGGEGGGWVVRQAGKEGGIGQIGSEGRWKVKEQVILRKINGNSVLRPSAALECVAQGTRSLNI